MKAPWWYRPPVNWRHAALLVICTLWCASARALPPTAAPDYVIYAVGSDSQSGALQAALNQLLTSLDLYSDDPVAAQCEFAANSAGAQWLIAFGSTRQALSDGHGASVAAGSKLLLLFRLNDNDSASLAAMANAAALAYPAVSAIAAATDDGCGLSPGYHLQSGFAQTMAVPDFAVTAIDLQTLNNPANILGGYIAAGGGLNRFQPGAKLGVAQLGGLQEQGLYQKPYALAVTDTLYSGSAGFPHPKTGFSRMEAAGILAGTYTNWNQLYADDGTALPSQPLVLLDRTPGSGIKAAANAYFLQNPQATFAGGAVTAYNETTAAAGGGPNSASAPTGCVAYTDYNEPGSASTAQDLYTLNSAGCLAVGLLEPRTSLAPGYDYARLDGVDPLGLVSASSGALVAGYADAIRGNYELLYGSSFINRNRALNGAGWLHDGSYRSVFIQQFATALQNPALPAGARGGAPGLLLDPAVTGASGDCTTLASRLLYALSPLVPVFDATFGALPTCQDSLRAGGPSLLNNSNHAAFDGELYTSLVGQGVVGISAFVDATQPASASPQFVTPSTLIQDATNAANTYYSTASNAAVNHQPYRIVSTSASGYNIVLDIQNYAAAVSGNVLSNMAYVGSINPGLAGQPPPVAMTVVDYCQDSASYGAEFCINQGYHQTDHCFTDSPSDTTNCFGQMLAALAYKHPGWNNFDLIAAFQQTAANWSSGYAHASFGYGAISFEAATAIASATLPCPDTGTPTSLCLRPPLLLIQGNGCGAQLTLFPSLTTRRRAGGFEAIYAVNPSYAWPQKNEYSVADLTAAGATLLYTSNGGDMTPAYGYTPSAAGTVTFAAFTSDGKGRYSRMEAEFGMQQMTFSPSGAACEPSGGMSRPAAQPFHSSVTKHP